MVRRGHGATTRLAPCSSRSPLTAHLPHRSPASPLTCLTALRSPLTCLPIPRDLISLEAPIERAILVGAPRKRTNARHQVDEHLEELERLADTAGAQVVGQLTQQIDRPNPATYLGTGKLEELEALAGKLGATLIIFDDELTPSQGKNIEDGTGVRVMDRAELILDIFATRARTSEARMQVELAQLEYMLPRLTRMWTHLEKFRGGIGVRGPGETQLETDRRLIGHRIRLLKERLSEVQRSRAVQRQGRKNAYRAALVGYTNAGKSTVLRALSHATDVFVEDRLFATLDPLTREVPLSDQQRMVVTDTVGFIRKLPHHLVASFRATLEEVLESDLLLHVIDASHPYWEEQREVVDEVLAELGAQGREVLYVFNKIDRLSPDEVTALRERAANLFPGHVLVSAARGDDGIAPLRDALLARARAHTRMVELRLDHGNGRLLAELHRSAEVIGVRHGDDATYVTARLDAATLARAARQGALVVTERPPVAS